MKAIQTTEALIDYVASHAMPVHPVLEELAAETQKLPGYRMQIARDQGALMHFLAKLIGARNAVEVGTYTGYSAISVATALPEGGKLYTCDIDPENTRIAQRYFEKAGLGKKITLLLGPAEKSLAGLLAEKGPGSFDMMFIDADKPGMPRYFDLGLQLLRQGGLIIADNVLWSGRVLDVGMEDEDTNGIRRFNEGVRQDERVDRVMVNVADGLYLARKR